MLGVKGRIHHKHVGKNIYITEKLSGVKDPDHSNITEKSQIADVQDGSSLQTVVCLCASDAYRFTDVDARLGDGFAGLAVKALWQSG